MTANDIFKLSSIIDFDKDKLNTLSEGESKYKTDLTLEKGMDIGTGGHRGHVPPVFDKFVYKVPPFLACKVPFLA